MLVTQRVSSLQKHGLVKIYFLSFYHSKFYFSTHLEFPADLATDFFFAFFNNLACQQFSFEQLKCT